MAFNRVADWEIDKENPRTAGRHKLVSKQVGWSLVLVPSIAFVVVSWLINPLCFALSPVALAIIFFYSLTKRFTSFTQFFLGLALAVSPVGAWLAVKGQFAFPPIVLALGVVFWLVGFDLIYAIQDYEFDKRKGLGSMVVKFGIPGQSAIGAGHARSLVHLPDIVRFGEWSGRDLPCGACPGFGRLDL